MTTVKFDTELPILLARSREDGSPLSIGLVDLDKFKSVNDRYSHAIGDEVLVRVSGILAAATAESGWAARMGGEEFLLVFPAVTIDEALGLLDCLAVVSALKRLGILEMPVAPDGVSPVLDHP